MKWLAGAFLVANLCLVGLGDYFQPSKMALLNDGQGRLPRVSGLRVSKAPPVGSVEVARKEKSVSARYCGRISGFRSRAAATRFVRENKMLFDSVTVENVGPDRSARFWLVVPPLKDRKKALSVLARLQRGGVDSYLVTEGEYRFAISLGLFESNRDAQESGTRFQGQNIDTTLVMMPPNQLRYALAFEVGKLTDRSDIALRLQHYGHRLEVVKFQPCQGVATSSKSP